MASPVRQTGKKLIKMTLSINTDAAELINGDGSSPVLLLCEHASRRIPAKYEGLGLSEADRDSHAAWDPGAYDLGCVLSEALDAPFLAGCVSRLVYDCNRPPEAASAIPEKSERIEVPGNRDLPQDARDARAREVYQPFCKAVDCVLEQIGPSAVLVTIHSFTPVFHGMPRSVELGILHDADSRLADAMLHHANLIPHRVVARNEPYGPEDGVTHSLKLHGLSRGLANVMIEVRNDLLRTPEDIHRLAQELLLPLRSALEHLAMEENAS